MNLGDEDRLDLSPLDPTRNSARFDAMVRSVVARAAGPAAPGAAALMVRWWRPALALAASMALAAWGPSLVSARSTVASGAADPAAALLQWSRAGSPSSAAEVLDSLGQSR